MIYLFLNRHQAPKPTLFIFADTNTPHVFLEKRIMFSEILFYVKMLDSQHFDIFRKDVRRQMMKIRLITSQKSWIYIYIYIYIFLIAQKHDMEIW